MLTPKLDCVFIETTTACTRKCIWCTHHYFDIKPTFMSEKLFNKIMSDLHEIKFNGRLSFFLNGEPLLDKRLSKWINTAKNSCPEAFTFIITNGDLLTYERAIELLNSGLDAIKVNTYDDTTFESVAEVKERIPKELSKRILHLDYSKKTDWTNRGGTVPFGGKRKDIGTVCLRPFRQLYITTSGLVAQCCSDALNRYIMGNMQTQKLLEIWNGEPFQRVRNSLLGYGELNDLCKVCDLERTYETVSDLRAIFENR